MNIVSILSMVVICIVCAAAVQGDEANQPILGLVGTVENAKVMTPAASSVQPVDQSTVPVDVDLFRMAGWSLEYLINSPRKEFNYDPVFQCFPYQYPPAPDRPDPIVTCDTDARMDWEWYYMRDITGSNKGRDVEAGFHKRILSYVNEDGIVWSDPGCLNEDKIDAYWDKKDYIIHMWGAPKILRSLSEDYIRTKNPMSKELARKVMLALKRLAKWDDKGRCWVACGMGGLHADGTVAIGSPIPCPVVGPLVTYWQATGDTEALDFARAYADGMIAGVQPDGARFQPDGSFGELHGHCTMRSVWGVGLLGLATGDQKYVDFAKRSFDWVLSKGTGTGWFPAVPSYAFCTEICLISDMMSTASCVAEAGRPEYYDYVERSMRNYIANLQFVASEEGFEDRYRKMHTNVSEADIKRSEEITSGNLLWGTRKTPLTEEEIQKGMAASKKFQGGFYNAGLNDMENSQIWGGYIWKIAGCCAPEGIRAVYTSWINTIKHMPKSKLGPEGVYVNMSFSRTSQWGDVTSFMPDQGRISVKAKVSDSFFIRPPHWAPRDQVHAFVDSKPITVDWSGDYVSFKAKPGQEVTITYPLIGFSQYVDGMWEKAAPGLHMTFLWRGNMVIDTIPRVQPGNTPLFTGKVKYTPPAPE